jgi:hypothetical protein
MILQIYVEATTVELKTVEPRKVCSKWQEKHHLVRKLLEMSFNVEFSRANSSQQGFKLKFHIVYVLFLRISPHLIALLCPRTPSIFQDLWEKRKRLCERISV